MKQIKLTITPFHFEELINKGYSMDIICLLKMVEQGIDIQVFCSTSPKLKAIYQGLMRKGIVTEQYQLTLEGKSLMEFLNSPAEKEYAKAKPLEDAFERWWKAYPGTDTFTYKDKTFTGSRVLRAKKEDCKVKLNKILADGQYTIDQMVEALEYEIIQKKEASLKANTNKMIFMQNSLTYLNQATYEPFIELIKAGSKPIESKNVNIKDIDI